jgi:hypothetical protein
MNKNMKQYRVRAELKLNILKLIHNFKSKEEPEYKKITTKDVIFVLSEIINQKI